MDFADFLKTAPAAIDAAPPWSPPGAPAVPAAPSIGAPAWPIAVYRAVGEGIPDEPFVAYPMIPQRKGKIAVMVRCAGATEEAARAKAQEWIDGEVAKLRRAEERAKAAKIKT